MPWSVAAAAVAAGGMIYSADKSADAAKDAAKTSAEGQGDALSYQQAVESLPLAYRDASMPLLGQQYGLTMDESGNVISDGSTIDERVMSSPLYAGQIAAGESAIGRSASATGRLRGGATPAMLGSNAQDAYMNAYNQQLQGLSSFAQTPLNTNAIAGTMSGIGNTLAQGQIAAANAQQQGYSNAASAIGTGLTMYGNQYNSTGTA